MISEFWRWPWKFRQNGLIFSSLMIVGFMIEYLSREPGIKAPLPPDNIYALVGFILLSCVLYYLPLFNRYIKWALSFRFVITAVSYLGILTVISGFIPQGKSVLPVFWEKLAFSCVTSSIPYAFLTFLICQSLLFACLNRLPKFKFHDLPFLLNHLGLLIILLTAALGSSELQRLKMDLFKGKAEWRGYEYSFGKKVNLPFALKLDKFILEEYPPEVLLIDTKTGTILDNASFFSKDSKKQVTVLEFGDLQIHTKTYLKDSFEMNGKYIPMIHEGTQPALEVKVLDKTSSKEIAGWITSGSHVFSNKILKINDKFSIALAKPRPKEFRSKIKYYTPEGETGEFTLLVNQPYQLKGWKIYQYGYDNEKGKFSDLSTVEVIKDPWLPAVYFGFYLLMAGTILMLIIKRKHD